MFDKVKITYLLVMLLLAACASIGTPDGGPYDEEPPVFLSGTPSPRATNVTDRKIVLNFDENVKLEDAFENVIISPPQIEMPQIKASGKHVSVELLDSLKPNTTYSINFNDAVVDNNESNPLEGFSYVFSTGENVDTMGVSGTVLNAEDLEPIKGILVGLHKAEDDSAFFKKPFEYVSRTDASGHFSIKGIAPGKYRIYALADANQNYLYDQKSEKIALYDALIEPFATPAVRQDTIWRDSVTIDTIREVPYIRLRPDDIVLTAFNEPLYNQYLLKSTRTEHTDFTLFFAEKNESLPRIDGLDFDAADAFIIEPGAHLDTIRYWLQDSTVYNRDTISLAVTYNVLDSMGLFVPRSDTLILSPRKRRETILKEQQEEREKAEKNFIKAAKRRDDYDENNPPKYIPPTKELKIKTVGSSSMDVNANYTLDFTEPLSAVDTTSIHVLKAVNDSTWVDIPYVFRQNEDNIRRYTVYAEWRPEEKYKVSIDSAAFHGLYGGTSFKKEDELVFRSLDDYAVLYLRIPGTGNSAIVELLGNNGAVVDARRTKDSRCSFFFINPGKYFLRLIIDSNGNGVWDTGDVSKNIMPEKVSYYPHALDLRALFEYTQDDWDINMQLDKQKPLEITKQKPERKRVKRNRNANRDFK